MDDEYAAPEPEDADLDLFFSGPLGAIAESMTGLDAVSYALACTAWDVLRGSLTLSDGAEKHGLTDDEFYRDLADWASTWDLLLWEWMIRNGYPELPFRPRGHIPELWSTDEHAEFRAEMSKPGHAR